MHADSPFPRSDQPPAALLWGTSVKYHQEARGSQDNTRRQPHTVRDAHGCWTAAMRELRRTPSMRTSENAQNANFAITEFSEVRLCASGPRLLTTEAGGPLLYSPTTKKRTDLLLTE